MLVSPFAPRIINRSSKPELSFLLKLDASVVEDVEPLFDRMTLSRVMPGGTGIGVEPMYECLDALLAMLRDFVEEKWPKWGLVIVFERHRNDGEKVEDRTRGFITIYMVQ
jgi:hypothetical protein